MSKGSSNLKSKKSHSSKPYDVSQSFVAKVASRVSELLPQRAWLNRWLSSDVTVHHNHATSSHVNHPTSTPMVNSLHQNVSPDHQGPGPSKRPRLPFNSPPVFLHNKFLPNTPIHEEELSPIGPATIPNNDSAVAGPSGLCQFNKKNNFTPTSSNPTSDPVPLKLEDKLTAGTQRSSVITDKLNGGDDCSETSESTSGCSSLVPQAQTLQNRRSESRHLNFTGNRSSSSRLDRSLFPGQSSPKIDLTSLHRRRPSFDTSTFTSSSRQLLNMSANPNPMSSPFYNGRTMYGGASACNTSMSSATGLFAHTPRRSGVTVRPVNTNTPSEPALSTTAKKILDALEQFSTPVVDAKRLPIMPGSKRKLERYAELNLPTTSDLLRVKRKERLQKSTSAARQASLSSSFQDSKLSSSGPSEYRIRDDTDDKHTSKITRKGKDSQDEQLEEVNLPTAVLPIKTLPKIDIPIPPCPKITTTTTVITNVSRITTASTSSNTGASSCGMKFSSPTNKEFKISTPLPVKADVCSRTNLDTEHFNFVFSEPIGQNLKNDIVKFSFSSSNKNKDSSSSISRSDNSKCSFLSPLSGNKTCSVENESGLGFSKSSLSSKDIKGKNISAASTKADNSTNVTASSTTNGNSKVKTPDNSDYWKCSVCMLKNRNESNVCFACETKKKTGTSVTSSSPLVFKPPPDTWECKECLIRNKNSVNVCNACKSPKTQSKTFSSSPKSASTPVSTNNEAVKAMPPLFSSSTSSVTSTTVTSGFGDKLKSPGDSKGSKFVSNKNTPDNSVSCSSNKSDTSANDKRPTDSTGFGNLFKKPEGSWECGTCMIRNDSKSLKCVACETPKPGAEKEIKAASSSSVTSCGFTFGIPSTPSTGTGFTLPNAVGTDLNKKDVNKTVSGFQFGGSSGSSTTNVSANFTFGIPSVKPTVKDTDNSPKEKKSKTIINDKMPNPLQELAKLQEKQSGPVQNTFKFGINHDKSGENQENNSDKSISPNKNILSSVEINTTELNNKTTDNLSKSKSEVTTNTFVFGSNTSEKTDSNANKTSNFVFQPKTEQTVTAGANLLFGNLANKPTQSDPKSSTQSDLFSFGSSTSNNSAFSTATSKSNPNPLFVFGSASSSTENKQIVFGSSNKDSAQKPTLPVTEKSVFGSSKETMPVFGNAKSEVNPPVFGSNLVNDSKPLLSSSLTNSTNVPTFATPSSSNSNTIQGNFKQETPTTVPSFLNFGSNAATPSPFQNQANTQQPEKSLFGMSSANSGLQSTIATTQSSGFSFGSGTANSDTVKQPFPFGSSQLASSGFSFAPSSTTPAQNFNFTPKEAEPSVGFNFTPVTPAQTNQTPTPVFGVQNPTPNFGSSNTSNNIFAFGAQSAQPQPQPAASAPLFAFNNSQASTPASNAFVFGSANTDTNQTPVSTAQPSVPAFNPNARPTFNFTGGSTPSFTATPNTLTGSPVSTPVTRRLIKKAVRRSGQIR